MFANVPPLKEYYRSLGDKLRLGFLFIIPNIYSGSINWIQSNYKGVGLATLYQILEEILLWAALSCCPPPVPGSTSTGHQAGHALALQSRAAEFTDCRAVPVVWVLLLHQEAPRDGDWSPEAMVGHPTSVGHWDRGAAVAPRHICEKSLGLDGPKASVDTPGTDVAPERKKPKRDVCQCSSDPSPWAQTRKFLGCFILHRPTHADKQNKLNPRARWRHAEEVS